MAERPSALNVGQWGVETTPGTLVAANKRLLCTGFDPSPNVNLTAYTPVGFLAPTAIVAGKETVTAPINGVLCFADLVYLFSSYLRTANSTTTPAGATLSRKWSFKPSVSAVDPFQTYTLEKGTASQAERFVYATVDALTLRWTEREANLSGSITGQQLTESVTITPTPTDIPAAVVDPKSIALFIGNSTPGTNTVQTILINGATGTFVATFEGQSTAALAVSVSTAALQTALQGLSTIGTNNVTVTGVAGTNYVCTFAGDFAGLNVSPITLSGFTGGPPTVTQTTPGSLTRLPRDTSCEVVLPSRYMFPLTLNDADPSFSFVVQKAFEPKVTLIMQHDATSAALMTDLRARTQKYLTIFCRGAAIESGFASYLKIQIPFKFDGNQRGDQAGVYSSTYSLAGIYDSTFAGFLQADVQCGVTAL